MHLQTQKTLKEMFAYKKTLLEESMGREYMFNNLLNIRYFERKDG